MFIILIGYSICTLFVTQSSHEAISPEKCTCSRKSWKFSMNVDLCICFQQYNMLLIVSCRCDAGRVIYGDLQHAYSGKAVNSSFLTQPVPNISRAYSNMSSQKLFLLLQKGLSDNFGFIHCICC